MSPDTPLGHGGHIDKAKLKKKFDLSHFDLNAILRGIQLTLVGGMLINQTLETNTDSTSPPRPPEPRPLQLGTLQASRHSHRSRHRRPAAHLPPSPFPFSPNHQANHH